MKKFLLVIFIAVFSTVSYSSSAQLDSGRLAKSQQRIEKDTKGAERLQHKINKKQKKIERQEKRLRKKENQKNRKMKSINKEEKRVEKMKEQ